MYKKWNTRFISNEKNKPCPFCNSTDITYLPHLLDPKGEGYILCFTCDARSPVTFTEKEAWEKWNQRSSENENIVSKGC